MKGKKKELKKSLERILSITSNLKKHTDVINELLFKESTDENTQNFFSSLQILKWERFTKETEDQISNIVERNNLIKNIVIERINQHVLNDDRETLQNITFEYNKKSDDYDLSVDDLIERTVNEKLDVTDYYLLIKLIDKYDWSN